VVKLLLARGADINARNKAGNTPLDVALGAGGRRGAPPVVRGSAAALLRAAGAVPSPPAEAKTP
jgi:ankyrin repeat protein